MLSDAERRTLENWAKRRRTVHGLVLRARIVLACADGGPNVAVGRAAECQPDHGEKWRTWFMARRLDGLGNEHRPGLAAHHHRRIKDPAIAHAGLHAHWPFRQLHSTTCSRRWKRGNGAAGVHVCGTSGIGLGGGAASESSGWRGREVSAG